MFHILWNKIQFKNEDECHVSGCFYFFNRFGDHRPAHAQIPVPGVNTRTYSNQGFQDNPLETESTSGADETENNPGMEPEYCEIPDIIPEKKNRGDGLKNKNYQSRGIGVKRFVKTYANLDIGFAESKV